MHCFQSILICEYIAEEAYLWDLDSQSLAPQNRSSTQKVPQRQKLWNLMTLCQLSAGPDILLRNKATMLRIISCTSKTIIPFFWRRLVRPRVVKVQSTLIFSIYSSTIGLRMVKFQYSVVPQGI